MRKLTSLLCMLSLVLACSQALADQPEDERARLRAIEEKIDRQQEQINDILELLKGSRSATPASVSQFPEAEKKYRKGWNARIFIEDKNYNFKDGWPQAEFGSFLATKAAYKLSDYSKHMNEAPNHKTVIWVGSALLNAKTAGSYTIYLKYDSGSPMRVGGMFAEVKLNGQSLKSSLGNSDALIVPTGELKPGLHRLQFLVGGGADIYEGHGTGLREVSKATFELSVKGPQERNQSDINEYFLVED